MGKDTVPAGSKAEILKRFGPDVLDYSKCEFVHTGDIPLPDAIKDMLNRCFQSFGWDVMLLRERWTGTLSNGKKENEVFPHAPGKDICCADTAAWALYQTGKLPHEEYGQKLWTCKGGGFHWAPYWMPVDGVNTDLVRVVHKTSSLADLLVKNDGDPRFNGWKPKDDDWLPGDYLLYSHSENTPRHPAGQPGHINVYLGPFREVVDGKLIDPVYHIINGSIHEYGGNAVVRPKSLDNLYWYLTTKQTVWHCRVVAIEALFREIVGYPVRLAKPVTTVEIKPPPPSSTAKEEKGKGKAKKEEKPKADPEAESRAKEAQIARLWEDATSPATAYPLGRNLSFHDGVHFHLGQHLATDDIVSFGPGQIALARMGGPSLYGDTSFVLVAHRVDPKTRRLLAPPAPKRGGDDEASKKKKKIEERALPLYSLYMHVAPLEGYLDPKEKIEGVPALGKLAPPWLRRMWVEPVPPPRDYVPDTAEVSAILTMGKDHSLMALAPATRRRPPHACDKSTCRKVTAGGKSYLALPHDALPSNVEAWSGHAPIAVVPKGAKLVYYNKQDGSLLEMGVAVPEGTTIAATNKGVFEVAAVDRATGDVYVAIRAFARPGFRPGSSAKAFEHVDETTIRVKGKLTLYLDTKGEGDEARLVPNQQKVLEGSPEKPITLSFTRSKAGKSHQADTVWIGVTACVKISAADKSEREGKLVKDMALATEVNARINGKQSTIFAAKIGKAEDWIVDDKGLLVPNEEAIAKRKPEAQMLTLYPQIKGTGKQRQVATPKPSTQIDVDAPSVLAIAKSGDVAVQPLELFEASGRRFALVEIMFAVDESAVMTSHAEEERIKAQNQKRKKIIDKLMKHEVVDFAALAKDGTIPDALRSMGAEVVGRFGKDEERGVPSFHFEIFSGKNVVDQSVKGTSGAVVPVPKSRWAVFKDDKDDFFTPAFIRRVLLAMSASPPPATVDARMLSTALATGVAQPAEWMEFYKANVMTLSRLITVHKPEWAIPWEDVWKAKDTRGRAWTEDLPAVTKAMKDDKAAREAAKTSLRAFRWWTEGVSLEGIDDPNAVFFYHPLRFIEWLKTGLDVTVVGIAKPEDAVIEIVLDGEKIPLDYDPISEAWSFRTVLGDIRQGKNAKLVLGAGFQTENREIDPVRIRRGEVTTISLVNPSLDVDVETDTSATGFAVAVKQASIPYRHAAYLLPDGNHHMARSAYSRATFRVDVAYNLVAPDSLTLTIEGDDLRFASYAITGIEVTSAGDGKPLDDAKKKPEKKAEAKTDDAPAAGEDGEPGGARVADDSDEDAGEDGDDDAPAADAEAPAKKDLPPKVLSDGTVLLPKGSTKREISLHFAAPNRAGPVTRSSSFSVTCEVMVTDAAPDEGSFGKASSVTLKAKVSGGDLGSREAKTMRIKTREIRAEEDGTPDGEDLAKLQLYLSQINAADHKPCYRLVGTHSAKVDVEVVTPAQGKKPAKTTKKKQSITVTDEYTGREDYKKDEKPEAVRIDGSYGGELAKALWRFVYSYAHARKNDGEEPWKLGAVKCTDKKGKNPSEVSKDEIVQVPTEELLDAHLPTFTSLEGAGDTLGAAHANVDKAVLERFLSRVNHPTEYPIVDKGLLSEIVRRFRTPFVLPRVTFDIKTLPVPSAHRDVVFTNDWNKNWISTSSLLPSDDQVILAVKCPVLDDVSGDIEVVIRVPDESAYRFAGGETSIKGTLSELCKNEGRHALSPKGEVGSDPKHNTVSVRAADGRLMNRVELCGVPDLAKPLEQPTRAAALLQIYLSVVPTSKDKPEPPYKHTEKEKKDKNDKSEPMMMAKINGKWDAAMVKMLEKWKSDNDVSGDYAATVKALQKAYSAAPATGGGGEDQKQPLH